MRVFDLARKRLSERGSQLVELALVLPLLAVLTAGVADFAQAWNARQILANAARDGARLGASQVQLDLDNTPPPSIQYICQQVADYLIQGNVNPAFMGISGTSSSDVISGCSSPNTYNPTSAPVPEAWMYYESGTTYGLKIERQLNVPASGTTCGSAVGVTCIQSTRVTLTYPYNWSFGFNHIIDLFGVTSGYASTITIEVYATMPDLA